MWILLKVKQEQTLKFWLILSLKKNKAKQKTKSTNGAIVEALWKADADNAPHSSAVRTLFMKGWAPVQEERLAEAGEPHGLILPASQLQRANAYSRNRSPHHRPVKSYRNRNLEWNTAQQSQNCPARWAAGQHRASSVPGPRPGTDVTQLSQSEPELKARQRQRRPGQSWAQCRAGQQLPEKRGDSMGGHSEGQTWQPRLIRRAFQEARQGLRLPQEASCPQQRLCTARVLTGNQAASALQPWFGSFSIFAS